MTIETTSARVSVYIDGFNLYKGLLASHPSLKWLDLIQLSKLLASEKLITSVCYFTAEIAPLTTSDQAPARQKLYLRTLEVSGVKVIKGIFRADPRWMPIHDPSLEEFTRPEIFESAAKSEALKNAPSDANNLRVLVTKFEEKRSDVNLASYLLRDIYERRITHAVVVSGDTDLATAIKFGVDAGCHISVYIPRRSNASMSLQKAASYVGWLKISILEQAQFPKAVISPKGKPLVRPEEWS